MNYHSAASKIYKTAPADDLCINCHASPKNWDNKTNTFHLYCSKFCAMQAIGQSNNNKNSGTNNCDHCYFFPKTWDSKRNTFHSYCSRTCANQALAQRNTSNAKHNIQSPLLASTPQQPYNPSPQTAYSANWSMMGAASSAVGKLLHGHANGYPAQRPPGQSRARILFYESTDPHYGFTNFSAHDVIYHGKRYPTSEHLFQAMKFIDTCPEVAEKIRTVSERPRDAFNEAHAYKRYQRADWLKVNIEMMDDVLLHKFTQHQDLKAELLGTGDAELIENSPYDAFWGNGKDKQGRNELGKALERLRSELRGF